MGGYFSNMEKEVMRGGMQVRRHHRRLLLQILRFGGRLSRADLASASGLSGAAITNVVAELVGDGLVDEHSPVRNAAASRMGRPATRLTLAADGPVVLAVQLGAGLLQVGLCDLNGRVVASRQASFQVPEPPSTTVASAIQMCRTLLRRKATVGRTLIGVGIGAAGGIDVGQRKVTHHAGLGWDEVPIADLFEKAFDVEAVVDHNVRAMAIGESRYGVGRGLNSLAFVYVRTGVGAGLILDGKAYRDRTNGAAEFGHMRVSGVDKICDCGGRGCLETVVSDALVRERMTQLGLLPAGGRDFADVLVEGVRVGDLRAIELRDELVEHLGAALLNVVNLLNPEVVVLGGLMNELSPVLLDRLRESLAAKVLPALSESIRIVPTAHDRDAGLVGAATVALDRFVFGDTQLPMATVS